MNDLIYTFDKLGQLIAANQRIAQLDAENQVLREQVAAAAEPSEEPGPARKKK